MGQLLVDFAIKRVNKRRVVLAKAHNLLYPVPKE
jgi:hypothetical protein